jgi:hypothetical protein
MRRRVVLLAVVMGLTAACGGGGDGAGDDAAVTTVSTTATTSTTSPTTSTTSSSTTSTTEALAASTTTTSTITATTAPQQPAFTDPLEFFRSTEAACIEHAARAGNAPPEPERFSGARVIDLVAFRVWLVEDGLGEEIVVDLEGGVVYSVDGPEAPLPITYSFGCPEDLYLGSLWD